MRISSTFVWISIFALTQPLAASEIVRLDPSSQNRAGVVVAPVGIHAFGERLRVVGQAVRKPGATVEVKSILGGRVEAIHAAPGDAVRRGQPLVTLHSHPLHKLQGDLLATHEALRLAENQVSAGEQLLELEGISRIELERRKQEALSARLALGRVEAELEDLGFTELEIVRLIDIGDTHPTLAVRAPADGVVLELNVELHGWVEAFEPLMRVGDPKGLELELQIPPDEAGRVESGDIVEFSPVGRPAIAGRGRVLTNVPQVDPMTRTVTLRAEISEGLGQLMPGVFVEGSLLRGAATAAPAVPEAAVARMGSTDIVFVRRDAETFEARPVRLGRSDGGRYEITAGLEPGEEIAIEGVFLLKSALVRTGEDEP